MAPDLARLRPWLRYDSHESFRADSAATLTDNVAAAGPNALKRAGGSVLARAGAGLSLALLGAPAYADGRPAKADDMLDAAGRDYVGDARRLHAQPGYADRVYGHVATDRTGATWLQYWLFYYYNDKQFLGLGLHEGDWEMIQLRLDADGVPDAVTFAQHDRAERASFTSVEKGADGAPVVYVARGSHASLLRRGRHPAPVVPDDCDAKGPLVRPALEELTARWVAWPGLWGSTRPRIPGESSSPRGPARHGQWADPLVLHDAARDARTVAMQALAMAAAPAPAPPELSADVEGDRAVVRWRLPAAAAGAPAARRLVLSLDTPGDEDPPATVHVVVRGRRGTKRLPVALQPGGAYVVRGRAVSANGLASEDVVLPVAGT